MQILNDDAIHLKFLLGLPVHIEGIGNFHAPLLTDIVDMTEEIYNSAVSSLFFSKKNIDSVEVDQFTDFQTLLLMLNHNDSFRELFFYGLNLQLDTVPFLSDEGLVYFDELSEDSVLTEDKFEYMKKLTRIANHIPEKSEEESYDFADERARKLFEKIKKNRQEVKMPQKINLHSIISAVGWKSQSFDFISKLNIYQLYEGYNRMRIIDNYEYTMTGIYTGNIDGSKIKLPDIDWANIIK